MDAEEELTKPISKDSRWFKIGETSDNLSDETDKIDFHKKRKTIKEFIQDYEKYVSLGGTNTLSTLTSNSSTLKKLQSKTTVSVDSNRQIEESKECLLELLDTLEKIKESSVSCCSRSYSKS